MQRQTDPVKFEVSLVYSEFQDNQDYAEQNPLSKTNNSIEAQKISQSGVRKNMTAG